MHSKLCAAWLFEPDSGRMGCIICALTEKMRMKEKQRSTPVELSLFSDEEMSATQHPSRQSPEPVSQTATAEPDGRFDALFSRLAQSKFRSSFYLNAADKAYIARKGWDTIRQGAAETIARRLAPAVISNDGRQTPMRHGVFPPFIAQHATGCCCRSCLLKWHGIPKGRALTAGEQAYLTDVVMEWLRRHV